ncbi:uroporphyrinogen-III C-methyltransferase [Aeromicrobium sp.]|uniref:uroporphyrinogen-III C-methyltransferase n=1 Tax=Aeromicrobium sp. TaxID=1871063 RepID=UPI003510D5B5
MPLPLTLRPEGRRVVVVGGGTVASRRVHALLGADADVVVVAPEVSARIRELADLGRLTWVERGYRTGDLDGAWLVQTATDSPVDDQVAADAEQARVWCLKGGDPDHATAWMPAVASVDDVHVAVSGGGDARRASVLRDAVATALQSGDLPLRHRTHHPEGSVALVGGGPGDADLLTTRGRRLLAEADVVVVDRLAPLDALDELAPDVEVVDVGKLPDHHPVPQDEINRILVDRALAGKLVVRLKGGDPYVLGRGGEERQACEAAGVPVEVVPGVTSAIAVPAAAGIPVTHRGVATGFSVVTAHDAVGELPTSPGHTIVLLMGVRRLATTAEELVAAGHRPTTPVAVVERGCSPDQRVTVGTLATIAERCVEVGVGSPAVTVVGEVVRLSPAWT